jgi:cytochrome c oxidase assembly protein subunit 17
MTTPAHPAAAEKPAAPKKKICCACPDTKAVRDACVVQHGPESKECAALIAAHNDCLRAEGFNV